MCAGFVRIHLLTFVLLTLVAAVLLGNALFSTTQASYNFGFSNSSLPLTEKKQYTLSVECGMSEKFGRTPSLAIDGYFAVRESTLNFSIVDHYASDTELGRELRKLSKPAYSHWFTREELQKEFPALTIKVLDNQPRALSFSITHWNKKGIAVFLIISIVVLASVAFLCEFWIRSRERAQGKSTTSV